MLGLPAAGARKSEHMHYPLQVLQQRQQRIVEYVLRMAQWRYCWQIRHAYCMPMMQGIYLVADDDDEADAWVDALTLGAYITHTRTTQALVDVLQPHGAGNSSAGIAGGSAGRRALMGAVPG